jgi:hypothetical protein
MHGQMGVDGHRTTDSRGQSFIESWILFVFVDRGNRRCDKLDSFPPNSGDPGSRTFEYIYCRWGRGTVVAKDIVGHVGSSIEVGLEK